MTTRKNALKFFISFLVTMYFQSAIAQTATAQSNIRMIRTGWNGDTIAVVTDTAITASTNPAGCSFTDGYVSSIEYPGYKTYYAAALLAYSAHKKITIIVSNTECASLRPKIIAIYLE